MDSNDIQHQLLDRCFVLMPFGAPFDSYYEQIFKPAITQSGLMARRADDIFRPSPIMSDISEEISLARILLADLTGKNPNVFYELGLAHARGKPAVLLSQTLDDVPFDLRHLRIVIYDRSRPSWGEELRNVISKTLLSTMQAAPDLVLPSFWRRHQVVPPGGLSSTDAEKLRNAYGDALLRVEGFKQVLRYNKIPYSERMEYQYIPEIDGPNYAAAADDDDG